MTTRILASLILMLTVCIAVGGAIDSTVRVYKPGFTVAPLPDNEAFVIINSGNVGAGSCQINLSTDSGRL
jgi:hypothetical protein